jgi:hypothetical protein
MRCRASSVLAVWAVLLALLVSAAAARAHVPVLRGRLVEVVTRSDLIVIGTARHVRPSGNRLLDTDIDIEHVLVGTAPGPRLSFRGPTRFAAGERYAFFLRRMGTDFEGVQGPGTLFPARRADDAEYRRTVTGIRAALQMDVTLREDAMRRVLIRALAAAVPELRYHAALELEARSHHGEQLQPTDRAALAKLLAEPTADPLLRPLLADLVRESPVTR